MKLLDNKKNPKASGLFPCFSEPVKFNNAFDTETCSLVPMFLIQLSVWLISDPAL